jgi:hypothetical protein
VEALAYALIEYDLTYESPKNLRGHIVADFIVEYCINAEYDISYTTFARWRLYFDELAFKSVALEW